MPRYRRNPHCAGRVVDGLAFVITPDDNKLHTLNTTATRLWQVAVKPTSVEEAAATLVADFEVDEETARRDAGDCLADLVARTIFVTVDP